MSKKEIINEKPQKQKLTRTQRREIDAVIRKYKGDGKPHTAQDSIPYETMYQDGVCRLNRLSFSKCIMFSDTNYQLAQPDDRTATFEYLCDLYNYVDTSIHVQFSFVNRRTDPVQYARSFEIAPQGDDFDDIRAEYTGILQRQLTRGNNGIVKTKYLTFTIEADNLKAARARLERIETDLLGYFKMMGAAARVLDGAERLEVLHGVFHPDGEVFRFDWSWLPPSGLCTKDFIAPSSLRFGNSRIFGISGKYGAVSFLQILAPELSDEMLADFLNTENGIVVNLHVQAIDQTEAIKTVKRKITDLDAMKIQEQKKAVRSGYDMDILPSDLATYGTDAKQLLSKLQTRNERLFMVTFLILNMADTQRKLSNDVFRAAGVAQKYNCALQKAERLAEKANIEYFYQKALHDNPQLAQAASNPIPRFWQKRQIKQQYVKAARAAGQSAAHGAGAAQGTAKAAKATGRAAKEAATESERLAFFAVKHWKGCLVALALLIMTAFLMGGLQSCSSVVGGFGSSFTATSYLSDDADLIAVENAYVGMENALQTKIDNIPSTYPGYDEYRYDLDEIIHNPHELASYLTAILPRYTLAEVQAELQRVFDKQYTLTTTRTVEVRYRTETRTDSEGNSYTVQVPYNYYILNVKLTARSIVFVAPELLMPEQLQMFNVYLETSGNNPLVFGGGSPDISPSEDISGVHFDNGTRPGNTAVVDIAKSQVGNVNGQPYWSWYGFDSRVAWCACFVSWCYNQAGLSEPRFSGCTSGGMAWFQSHGQWANRGYSDIAPGDAIFFDWDNSGNADHVGIVIGTDGTNVYTVEGNSGNACKIKSYPLNSSVIRGYGLMNWD